MLRDEKQWVVDTIKAAIAEALAGFKVPAPTPPKPVEVDIDGIVKLILDKIKLPTPVVAAEAPKKGKEK